MTAYIHTCALDSKHITMGGDIHTHVHAQDNLYNKLVEQMGTVLKFVELFWAWVGYDYRSSNKENTPYFKMNHTCALDPQLRFIHTHQLFRIQYT